tara:strand:- start:4600 stop:4923 length:324 start_codon:yes stop_codon:yes gene_type:complete
MDYGKRPDGQEKGNGFFGKLKRPDGDVSTEISFGVGIEGKETLIPLIVPSLTKSELSYLLKSDVKSKTFFENMPKSIINKAVDHAVSRMSASKSPFAGKGEVYEVPK